MRKRRWRRFKAFARRWSKLTTYSASTRPSWTSSAAKESATKVNSPIWRKVPPIQNWRHPNSRFPFLLFSILHHFNIITIIVYNIVRPAAHKIAFTLSAPRESAWTICRSIVLPIITRKENNERSGVSFSLVPRVLRIESNEIDAPIYIVFSHKYVARPNIQLGRKNEIYSGFWRECQTFFFFSISVLSSSDCMLLLLSLFVYGDFISPPPSKFRLYDVCTTTIVAHYVNRRWEKRPREPET